MPPLTFIDLFSGSGGATTGLRLAGLTHICGVELNHTAALTYAANHDHVLEKSVCDVTRADFEAYLQGRALDVLIASPPCQSFSRAGRYNTPNEIPDNLYKEVIRVAELLNPEYVIIENVPPFATKRIHGELTAVDDLLRQLGAAGYARVEWRILDASEYEVPQKRRRLVMIARRTPGGQLPWPEPVDGYDASIERFLESAESVPAYYWMSSSKMQYYLDRMAIMPSYVRILDPRKPAFTLRASYFKSRGADQLILQGGRLRMMTEAELARIQTYPADYTFVGGHGAVCTQIGNSVPCRMYYHLGKALLMRAHEAGVEGGA